MFRYLFDNKDSFKYKNGNYSITIKKDGTKIRNFKKNITPCPEFPESMDVKITNKCNGGCGFCHEGSSIHGKHCIFDEEILDIFKQLPAGTETALGGGDTLCHPGVEAFVSKLNEFKLIPNITVNSKHICKGDVWGADSKVFSRIYNKVYGIGVSYNKQTTSIEELITILDFCSNSFIRENNLVFHFILGIHTVEDLINVHEAVNKTVKDKGRPLTLKVLLLGYKQVRNGAEYYSINSPSIENEIYKWYIKLPFLLQRENLLLSFDNLAITQLNMQRLFTDEGWEKFYMGGDGQFTMYLDLVKREFAVSSTSKVRHKLLPSIKDMFKIVREEAGHGT
jgi:hypothetical protein